MLEVLYANLLEKPELYLEEMAVSCYRTNSKSLCQHLALAGLGYHR